MYLSLFILKIFYLFTYLLGFKVFFFFLNAYLFDCAMSYLGHTGSSIFVAACGIFSCGFGIMVKIVKAL